jgi:hypothetical protein
MTGSPPEIAAHEITRSALGKDVDEYIELVGPHGLLSGC